MDSSCRAAPVVIASTAIALLISSGAQAQIVYDNIPGFPNSTNPVDWCSACGSSFQVYQPFSLGSAYNITSTDFAIQFNGSSQTITVSVWNAALNTELFSQTLAPGSYTESYVSIGFGYDVVSANLSGLSLSAGDYYISYAGINMAIPGWTFGQSTFVQTYGYGDTDPAADLDDSPYIYDQSGAFDLAGTPPGAATPLPSTWIMMLTGLVGLGFVPYRQKKKVPSLTAL